MSEKKSLALLLLVTICIFLPFINKPFNVDDPFYIKMAQHILTDPVNPYNFDINWSGETRNVWDKIEATFPPLIPYYMAVIIKIFGLNEAVMHLSFLFFPVICALAVYFLFKKYTEYPLLASVLFISTPAFFVSATSVMLDVPLAAFMTASIALYIYGSDRCSPKYMVFGSIFAVLAVLTKYTGLIVLPVVFFYMIKHGKIKNLLYLLIPVVFFILWCIQNYYFYNGVHFLRCLGHVGRGLSVHKMIALMSFLSGCFAFPVIYLAKSSKKELAGIVTLFLLLLLVSMSVFFGMQDAYLYALLAVLSCAFIYFSVKNSKDIFLSAWFVLCLFISFIFEPWTAARYLLLLLVPAVIIFSKYAGRAYLTAGVIVSFAVSVPLAVSDYLWADAYKKSADYFAEKYSSGCFTGHMGFQYYMEKNGWKALEVKNDIDNSYIVVPRFTDTQKINSKVIEKMKFVEQKAYNTSFPLRLMNQKIYAGFYSSFWGVFPFAVSKDVLDEFALYLVSSDSFNLDKTASPEIKNTTSENIPKR